MKKFAESLAVGFALGTLLVGASSIETHYALASEYIQLAAGDTSEAGTLPDTQLSRAEYETQMQAVMDDRAADIRDLRDEEPSATDEAVAALESSWLPVEKPGRIHGPLPTKSGKLPARP